jgi:ABC-type lipoprotein export system ATPase subunit
MTTLTETAGDERTTASESPVVRFREVGKVYDDEGLRVTAIRSVTFDIPKQRFAMIVGPSGSGKTTLLNLIGCIDTPTSTTRRSASWVWASRASSASARRSRSRIVRRAP